MRADLVIRGGRIFTAEPSTPFVSAVVVEGGDVVGRRSGARADRPPHRTSVDGGCQVSANFGEARGRRRRRELHRFDAGDLSLWRGQGDREPRDRLHRPSGAEGDRHGWDAAGFQCHFHAIGDRSGMPWMPLPQRDTATGPRTTGITSPTSRWFMPTTSVASPTSMWCQCPAALGQQRRTPN